MLIQNPDNGGLVAQQALFLRGDPWVMEVVPRLPAHLAEPARALKTLQQGRVLLTSYDLL